MENKNININYLNRDFKSLRTSLINLAKTYYPNTYTDFNPTSPGMMFVDMAAYIGDVLSYYIDDTFKETLLNTAERRENILEISQALGYKPKATAVASTDLDIFMTIPSVNEVDNFNPDWDYALTLKPGLVVESSVDQNIRFRTDDYVIFKNSQSYEEQSDIFVYEKDVDNNPTSYLLKKTVQAISATETSITFSMPDYPKKYHKIQLPDTNVIEILSVVDSEGNEWYDVPYLAQDTIFEDELNIIDSDYNNITDTQYLLRLKKVNRRFTTKLNSENKIELQFGSGVSTEDDEDLVPNPFNVGSSLIEGRTGKDSAIDPSNFLYTKTYGDIPYNTDLTITYLIGGGIKSNVPSNDLTNIVSIEYEDYEDSLSSAAITNVKNSIAVNNPSPAVGGKGREDVEEIRQNAIANFASQKRTVTKEDYIFRTYSMPSKYGSIAKAYITQDQRLNKNKVDWINNPLALDLFVLGYDKDGYLTTCNNATKQNLKTYLSKYRMLTDAINILDAYVINIGVNFDIVVISKFNKKEVILRCINEIRDYFNIKNWQINQPIILSDIINKLYTVKGVQNVNNVNITNLWRETKGYSGHSYNINNATKDGIIYTSADPSIFEVKYTNDIKGRAR